jgi:hypothetical protein
MEVISQEGDRVVGYMLESADRLEGACELEEVLCGLREVVDGGGLCLEGLAVIECGFIG